MADAPRTDVSVTVDAWTGTEAASGDFAAGRVWGVGAPDFGVRKLVPSPADQADWRHPTIGWGVVLPDREGLTHAQLATADDAPEPIRALVAARSGKVLRYHAEGALAAWTLRDYAGGGDLLSAASPPGMGKLQLPMYLLIVASPAEIPWQVQYALNPVRRVGRLDLDDAGLGNYVEALLGAWSDTQTTYAAPLVWAVDHGGGDITSLMRDVVAEAIFLRLDSDADMPSATFIDGREGSATNGALSAALAAGRPRLVVTSSHGMTGPLNDPVAMRANLGLPVDQDHAVLSCATLLSSWQPDGAVWFSQACCSAGADQPSSYAGLFDEAGSVARVLAAVADLGPQTSPLPKALLGAEKPLRAFVGHVEPTFDWTLRFPPARQSLTSDLVASVYDGMCSGQPVGLALSSYYQAIGALLLGHVDAVKDFNRASGDAATAALDMAVYSKVTAFDRASLVLLGDPTVAMPLPGA